MGWIDAILHAADSTLRAIFGMRPKFLLIRKNSGQTSSSTSASTLQPEPQSKPKAQSTSASPQLVKPRPLSLEDRYTLSDSPSTVSSVFQRFSDLLFEESDALSAKARRRQGGVMVAREIGKTSEGRSFIYLKPYNDFGWLVERVGPGWRISRAEKIVNDQVFLRSQADPWDIVMVYEDPQGVGATRVKSLRFGNSLLAWPVYEQKMREQFSVVLEGSAAGP